MRQFKRQLNDAASVGRELVAFLNTKGGVIYVGVEDDGTIYGVPSAAVDAQNQLVANAATHHVIPPAGVFTENVLTSDGMVIVVTVDQGDDKPYQVPDGSFYVKRGADKRKVTNRSELQRMFQAAHTIYGEARRVAGSTLADFDRRLYAQFYEIRYGRSAPEDEANLLRELTASRLADGALTIAGVMLFGTAPERLLPEFAIKAVWYRGIDRGGNSYYDSRRFVGTLAAQYEQAMAFLRRWNARIQAGGTFNGSGVSEIPDIVFEDLLTNALVHRDYLIQDSIKVFIFDDRIEIRSPGRLPNSLTVDQARRGIRRDRNPVIQSFAYDLLNYKGLGSGLLRAIQAWSELVIAEDFEAEELVATIPLPPPDRPITPEPPKAL